MTIAEQVQTLQMDLQRKITEALDEFTDKTGFVVTGVCWNAKEDYAEDGSVTISYRNMETNIQTPGELL